jgi:hypothetical protein
MECDLVCVSQSTVMGSGDRGLGLETVLERTNVVLVLALLVLALVSMPWSRLLTHGLESLIQSSSLPVCLFSSI